MSNQQQEESFFEQTRKEAMMNNGRRGMNVSTDQLSNLKMAEEESKGPQPVQMQARP